VTRLTGKLKKPSGMCKANCGCIIQCSKLENEILKNGTVAIITTWFGQPNYFIVLTF
jgi:hypothetical protein